MKYVLITLWLIAIGFFVWEFANAEGLPKRYANAKPSSFRIVDSLFTVVTIATIWYIAKH